MNTRAFEDHLGRMWTVDLLRPEFEQIAARLCDLAKDRPEELAEILWDRRGLADLIRVIARGQGGRVGTLDDELRWWLTRPDKGTAVAAVLCNALVGINPENDDLLVGVARAFKLATGATYYIGIEADEPLRNAYLNFDASPGRVPMTRTRVSMMTLMSDTEAIIDEAGELLCQIAPELGDQPLYITGMPMVGPGSCCSNLYGCAWMGYLPLEVIAVIGPQYRGPGPAICLNFQVLEADCQPTAFRRCVMAVALHEAAHLLPVVGVEVAEDTPMGRIVSHAAMASLGTIRPLGLGSDPQHDWGFVRRYVHLFVRAQDVGFDVSFKAGLTSFAFTGFRWPCYLSALEGEARAMKDLLFEEIESTPPPPALLTLWHEDVDFYSALGRGYV